VHVVAQTSTAPLSGFPQLQRHGARLILAWTDASVEPSVVRTVSIDMGAR
jgi:hypothetical protein